MILFSLYWRFYIFVIFDVYINHLIAQHAWHIGNVQPSVTLLGDELGEVDLPLALHLDDEMEESEILADPLSPLDSSPSMGSTFGVFS